MIKVNLSADPDGMQAEVDASAYMAELWALYKVLKTIEGVSGEV